MEERRFEHTPFRARSAGHKAARIMGLGVMGVVFATLFALVFGLIVKWLWNGLMPDIFGLGLISYWQAFGLVILAKLLFGGFGHHIHDLHHPRSPYFSDRPENGSSWESRSGRPFDRWRHYDRFWREEGRAAFDDYLERMRKQESAPNGSQEGPVEDNQV